MGNRDQKKILIVGVGALGSHVVQFLRSEEIEITIVDFDRVEQKNVASQFHSKSSQGKKKVEGLKQTMNFLFGKNVKVIPNKLAENNEESILSGYDLIIDCFDNGESRRIIQEFVRKNQIPCLHGALAAEGSFAQVAWDEKFKIDDAPAHGAPTCQDGEFLPFIALTSAYIALYAKIFLQKREKLSSMIGTSHVLSL